MSEHESGPDAKFVIGSEGMVRNIALAAVSIEIALVVLDFSLNYARPGANSSIRRLFNITREDALASWFATTQTFLIALTLCVITVLVRQGKRSALSRRGWLAVTLFFFYMAVDDGTKLHERVGSALGDLFEKGSTTDSTWISRVVEANPSYNWQLFLMPVFLVAGVAMLLFLWREVTDRRDRALLLLALACFAVAIGLDFVEGLDEDDPRNPYVRLDSWLELDVWAGPRFDKSGFAAVVHFSKSLEEFLEMFGNTLMWVVFLRYLTGIRGELRLRFR